MQIKYRWDGMSRRLQNATPRRQSWHKLSDRAQCEIARRLRTMGVARVARSLSIGKSTLESLIDGGTARENTVARVEAAVST